MGSRRYELSSEKFLREKVAAWQDLPSRIQVHTFSNFQTTIKSC